MSSSHFPSWHQLPRANNWSTSLILSLKPQGSNMMQSNDLTASGTVLLCCPKERQMQCGIWMPLVDTGPSRHPWKLKSDHIVAKISNAQCLSIARNGMKKGTNFCCCSVTRLYPTLQPHGLQHTRLSCPSPFPRFCSNSDPLN